MFILILTTVSNEYLNSQELEFFEGDIEFSITYESINPNISEEFLESILGDKMIGIVKHDKYKTIKPSSAGFSGRSIYYFLDENTGYIDYDDKDTIFKFKLDESPGYLIEMKEENKDKKEILGQKCPSILIDYVPNDQSNFTRITGRYYYDSRFKLDPEKYKNHKESFWNLYVEKSGSISVRNEITNYPIYKSIYQALKVIPKEVDDSEFELNPKKIIVEIE